MCKTEDEQKPLISDHSEGNYSACGKIQAFLSPSIPLYAFSLTLNEGGGNWGGTEFKSVSSATWSAVLVNRFDGKKTETIC